MVITICGIRKFPAVLTDANTKKKCFAGSGSATMSFCVALPLRAAGTKQFAPQAHTPGCQDPGFRVVYRSGVGLSSSCPPPPLACARTWRSRLVRCGLIAWDGRNLQNRHPSIKPCMKHESILYLIPKTLKVKFTGLVPLDLAMQLLVGPNKVLKNRVWPSGPST